MNKKLNSNKKNHTSHITHPASQRGITLIALAVTIIVLAILAGVTINMVLGDEGIITQANQEKDNQERETDIENITLIVAEEDFSASMDGGTRSVSNIDTGLDNKFKKNVITTAVGEDLKVEVDTDRVYKVDKYGKVSDWNGATTAPITTETATATTTTATATPTPVPTTRLPDNPIYFTACYNDFVAESGMTWGEWFESEWNTLEEVGWDAYIDETGIVRGASGWALTDQHFDGNFGTFTGIKQTSTTVIQDGGDYDTAPANAW